jgi:hypothetical protein
MIIGAALLGVYAFVGLVGYCLGRSAADGDARRERALRLAESARAAQRVEDAIVLPFRREYRDREDVA